METQIRSYNQDGEHKDEGGTYTYKEVKIPSWVEKAIKKCAGCHDDFYNYRANCGGKNWCYSLKQSFVRLKGKPSCFH